MTKPRRVLAPALTLAVLTCLPLAAQERATTARIEVNSLKFTGVEGIDEAQLRSVLATKSPGWLPWSEKPAFDRERFQADLQRIQAFYVDRGFPDAKVGSFGVELNEAGTKVDLTVHVIEGQPTLLTELVLDGFGEVPERRLRGLRRRLAIREGQPLDRSAIATGREMLADELRDRGYPYPRIAARIERGATEHEARVVITATTGPRAYFGETEVEGESAVDEGLIRRSLLFGPGDVYRRSAIQETQRKLYGLELFEFVNVAPVREPGDSPPAPGSRLQASAGRPGDIAGVQPLPDPAQSTARFTEQPTPSTSDRRLIPMRITVTEGNHNRVRMSAGYGTEEKARGEVQYRQLNFLGGGRSAGVHAKWSSLDRGVRVDLAQPFVFHPRLSFSINGQRWYNNEPAFRAVQSGGHATLTYGPGLQTTFSVTATSVYHSSRISNAALQDLSVRPLLISWGLDPRTGGQDGTLNALSFDIRRDTSQPNPLNATRGYALALHLEQAFGVLGGNYKYPNLSADARFYRRVFRRFIVALRGQAGSITPQDGLASNVPFGKRYFLGGSTNLRGWGRYEVSPLSGSGLPLGGFSMFQATAEVRTRLVGQLGLVLFADAGNVWTGDWEVQLGDLRYSVGPGLRYQTPIGPIRLDLGYQVNPIPNLLVDGKPESRRWRVHFSIGQAF